ncbi:uncharacterized protein KY384_008865 [Bacidia gigantensis]|uniref:uncharacterized protein n=1 Tax=Bacidia gigantensis TaxID=2732470 RepID=UPI001D043634|nr:uncharacterized protein KY384_008865 [Bacidia gigantensis]KAG8525221.1 hypothetical protein KY384_008865 [Bacidia gigantensis]
MTASPLQDSFFEYDFAPQPPPGCLEDDVPRAWSLRHPAGSKNRTIMPLTTFNPATRPPLSSSSSSFDPKPYYTMATAKTPRLRWTRRSDKKSKEDTPEMTIAKTSPTPKQSSSLIASVQLNPLRTSCTLTSPSGSILQSIHHDREPRSRYHCVLGKERNLKRMYWQTLGPSQTVLELIDPEQEEGKEKRIALFVYTSDPAQQMDPESGRRRPSAPDEFGALFATTDLKGGEAGTGEGMGIEGLVCSALLVTEMRRTRKA